MFELTASENLRDEIEQLLPSCTVDNPVVVTRRTMRTALQRFIAHELDQVDLVSWANLIELHDEVQYEPGFEKLIADVLFRISSPEINEQLTLEACHCLLQELDL